MFLFQAKDGVDHLVYDGVRLESGNPHAYKEVLQLHAGVDNSLLYAGWGAI